MRKIFTALITTLILATTTLCSACLGGSYYFSEYDHADLYKVGNFSYAAADVTRVEIDWVDGEVFLTQSQEQTLNVWEDIPAEKTTERMYWWLDGTTLRIQYCASGHRGGIAAENKRLHVELPQGIDLDVESVSASIYSQQLSLGAVDVECVSANLEGEAWTATKADLESVSGSLKIASLACAEVDADTVSGYVHLGLAQATALDLETVSGNVTVELLNGLGARLILETVSGELISEKTHSVDGKTYTFGGGESTLDVETVSGNVTVE